jgi:uncharacterized protein YjbJ (UPF0337 family)
MSMSSTNPGNRSAAEIEAEVDRERERVADTIGALQSKLSVQSLVDEASHALYEHGGEISRTFGRQLRDNPLAALVTGVGLAWLMAGAGSRARDDDAFGDRRNFYRNRQPELHPAYDPDRAAFADDDEGRGVGERAREWGQTVSSAATGAMDSTRDALGGARDALAEGGRSVRDASTSARDWGSRQAQGVQDSLSSGVQDHPLVLGGIAFAIGAALGAALPHTRAEDELVGPHADRMKEKAGEIASTEVDKAMAVASAAIDEGKQIVEEAADTLARKMPDADTLAERAREAALDAADRVRTAGEIEAEHLQVHKGGGAMNWDQIQGSWKQFKGKLQQQWGSLTDDDLDRIEGRQEELAGLIQERYGKTREEAQREIDEWAARV